MTFDLTKDAQAIDMLLDGVVDGVLSGDISKDDVRRHLGDIIILAAKGEERVVRERLAKDSIAKWLEACREVKA